jgi:N-acetylmuramoyl-L-alanine amidase
VGKSILAVVLSMLLVGCASNVGKEVHRKGDEIMVCGRLFHTGTPVVLWTDPGGYDAYRTERRFAPWDQASFEATVASGKTNITTPNRYGLRQSVLTPGQIEEVRGGGWPLELLQKKVDQFVIHYDVAGISRMCFHVLQDDRDLSVQFMCDIDGTIYQTLDLKERAWHATKSNSRSVGVEVANMGAYRTSESLAPLKRWYQKDAQGRPVIVVPKEFEKTLGEPLIRTPNFHGHPARPDLIVGKINDTEYRQYDFTPEQYAALTRLTATLCTVFPKLNCDVPRDSKGHVRTRVLTNSEFDQYQGVMGHYHVQREKQDPGPAFDFDKLIRGARKLMSKEALKKNCRELGHPVTPAAKVS